MAIQVRREGNKVVVEVSGVLKFAKRKEFPKAIAEGLAMEPQWLLCDIRKVTDIDSAGLVMLVNAAEECQRAAVQMGIVCADGRIKDLLRIANLQKTHKIFASATEADSSPTSK